MQLRIFMKVRIASSGKWPGESLKVPTLLVHKWEFNQKRRVPQRYVKPPVQSHGV